MMSTIYSGVQIAPFVLMYSLFNSSLASFSVTIICLPKNSSYILAIVLIGITSNLYGYG